VCDRVFKIIIKKLPEQDADDAKEYACVYYRDAVRSNNVVTMSLTGRQNVCYLLFVLYMNRNCLIQARTLRQWTFAQKKNIIVLITSLQQSFWIGVKSTYILAASTTRKYPSKKKIL